MAEPAEEPPQPEAFDGVAPPREGRAHPRGRPAIQRPIFFIALALLAGSSLGRQAMLPAPLLLGGAAGLAVWGAVGLALSARRPPRAQLPTGVPLFAAILLIGWAGSNRVVREDARADAIAERFAGSDLCRIEGRVCEPPDLKGEALRIVLDDAEVSAANVGRAPFPLKIQVRVDADPESGARAKPPPQGARVAAWGRIHPPASPAFPGDFSEALYLHGRGIGARLSARKPQDFEIVAPPRGWGAAPLAALESLREGFRANLHAALAPEEAAVALAFLLGDTTGVSRESYREYQRTGLAHILSVSGLHTAVVLGLLLAAGRAARLRPRWAAGAAIAGLAFYCALTGFLPPVVRASVMGTFILFAWVIGRPASTPAALAASACVTLFWDPRNLVRADWQLSYACAASLALLAPAIYEIILAPERSDGDQDEPSFARAMAWRLARKWIWAPLAATIAIQIGLLPLQLSLFRQFSVVSPLAQIVFVPWATLIMLGSIPLALFGGIPFVAASLGGVAGALVAGFQASIGALSSLRIASAFVPPMPWWLAGAYVLVALAGPHSLRGRAAHFAADAKQRTRALLAALASVAFVVWTPILAGPPRGLLEIYFVDVGQGDGMVLRLPNGKIGVIDGGKRWGKGEPPVARLCRSLGAERLDFVAATHADADHIGGLVSIVNDFDVGLFIRSPDISDSSVYADLQEALARKRVPVHVARAGERIAGLGGVEAHIIGPAEGLDNNDASVTILLSHGETQALLAGDIQARAERSLIERGMACDIDALKVAHHGSAGSSTDEFLAAFKPEIAIVSAGKGNSYGHPSPAALGRLAAHGAAVARTDELGTIRLASDGKRIRIEHYAEGD